MAVKEVSPEKLILLSPFNGIEYADFCSKVKGIFPKGLPAWVESSPDTGTILSVTWFDKDWNAQLAPVTWIDTSWRLDTRYPLGRALKEKFEAIRCEKRTLLDDVAIACKRVIASAWDALLVTSLLFILFISANKGSLQSLEQKVQHAPIFASALLLIGLILYQTLFEASGQMATLGKRSVGLLAVDMSSGPLTLIVSLKRALLKALLFPITWISLLFGSRATLHEHLSKTLVTNRAIRMREPAHFPFAASGWLFSLSTFVFLVWIVAVHGPRPDLSPLHFPNGSQSVTLDAANVGEDPLLEVKIKGQHLVFLFGTRSGNCVIDRRTAASLHLKTQPRKVNVFEGVGTTLHEVTERVTLGLGAANLVEPGLVISDLSRAEGIIGKRIDGVIGYTLLKTAVVTVNYETGKITLTNPKSFDYRGNGIVVPLSIHNGWASANATLKAHGLEPSQSEYWINTDLKIALTSPTFSGTTNFIPLGSRGPAYPQSKLAIPVGQFESIAIGNLRIEHLDMPCCARTTLGESQIGNGLLKRFVVIFDYTRQRLILERLHPEDETILTEKAGTEQHEIPRNNPEPRIPVAMKGTTAAGSAFPKANLVPKAPRSQKDSVPAPIVDPQHQAELERLAQVADKNSIWTGYPNCKVILGSLEVSPTPSSLETIDRIQCGESLEVLGKESKFYLVRTKRNILGYVVANAVSQSQ